MIEERLNYLLNKQRFRLNILENQEIIKKIKNLKGRRNYEEKKASKLGFTSLYAFYEDKILKEKKIREENKKELEQINTDNKLKNIKNSCSCCWLFYFDFNFVYKKYSHST